MKKLTKSQLIRSLTHSTHRNMINLNRCGHKIKRKFLNRFIMKPDNFY